jgi:hypothetical protein
LRRRVEVVGTVVILLGGLVYCGLMTWPRWYPLDDPRPPSVASLRSHFVSHAATYREIVSMLRRDSRVEVVANEYISPSRLDPASGEPGRLSVARLAAYRGKMETLGVTHVTTRREMSGNMRSVRFIKWSTGMLDSTRYAGIVWFPALPEAPAPNDHSARRVSVGPEWYVFED